MTLRRIRPLSLLCLLCLAMTATFWIRSFWRFDFLQYADPPRTVSTLGSVAGVLFFERVDDPHLHDRIRAGVARDGLMPMSLPRHQVPALFPQSMTLAAWFPPTFVQASNRPSHWVPLLHAHDTLILPHWLPAGLFLSGCLPWLFAANRRRRRLLRGLCPTCGYDVRASPERCPECGAAVTPRNDAVAAAASAVLMPEQSEVTPP